MSATAYVQRYRENRLLPWTISHATSSNTNPSFEVTLNRMTSTTLTGRPLSSSSLCLSDSMPFCAPYTLDPLSPTGNYRQDRVHLPHTRVRSFGPLAMMLHHSMNVIRAALHCSRRTLTGTTRARMNDEDISAGHSYEHAYSPRCHQRSFSAQHQYPLSRHRHPKTHPNMLPTVYIQSDLAQHQIRRSISDAIDTPNDVFTDDLPRIMHMSNTASPLKRSLDKPSSAHTLIGAEEGSPTTSDLRPQDHSGSF
ncbi:hypothetical protein BASA82_000332 [Batrachochytrium salamandrivorans]|nr:hypothetical protein BASA82_000332 [Batrachochytrium salamandrivorans]